MRLIPILLVTALILTGSSYLYLRTNPDVLPPGWKLVEFPALKQRIQELGSQAKERLASILPGERDTAVGEQAGQQPATLPPGSKPTRRADLNRPAPAPPPQAPLQNPVTLYLTNGGVVTGEFVKETPQEVILRWDYGEVGFARGEIRRMVKGRSGDGELITMPWEGAAERWPYRHDVVVRLMKGTVVDAAITDVTPESIILAQTLDGGGQIEHTIARADVEELLFRPIRNARSEEIATTLKTIFPAMHPFEEGMFTIVTDSAAPAVKEYRRTIRQLATDWYLAFFPVIKSRTPLVQQHVVIFENWPSYIEYAASDGVPGWLAVGYFHPEDEVLYCFNMVGEWMSELLFEAYLGGFRRTRDEATAGLQGSRYEVFVEGQISEFLQKLESAHATVRQTFRDLGVAILRHELTHAMFHNWQAQSIVLSQMAQTPEGDTPEAEQKRHYLQEQDPEQKRKLLDGLLAQDTEAELPQMQAANSWYVEGLAGYLEPSPIGGLNRMRLAEVKDERHHARLLPLEFLHVFEMGSFVGMSTDSALMAYAQSWALCHFFMSRYPEGFTAYLARLATERPEEGQETLSWLTAAVGKDPQALDQEFAEYLDQLPPEEPAWLRQMQVFIDLRAELTALASRLWSRYY